MLQGIELIGAYLGKCTARTNTVFTLASPIGGITASDNTHVFANTYASEIFTKIDTQEVSNYAGSVMHRMRGKRVVEGEFEITFPNNNEFTAFMTYILNHYCHIVTPDYIGYGIPKEIRALDNTYDHNLTLGITIEFDVIAQK